MQSVHAAGHVHIGEEHINVGMGRELEQCLIGVARLKGYDTKLPDDVGSDEANQWFILDYQNRMSCLTHVIRTERARIRSVP